MIQKLNIHNFQSHKNTTLTFSPGVNVIVGATDSGKTSIIRALRWLIWNRPIGDSFRSHWGGSTSVEIVIPERHSNESGAHKDQTTLMRIKSDKHNQYFLNGTDNVYKAFGNDVPEQIQKILNIDETNLQQQLDSPFLLSDSPGEVARYFNRVAHLDQIDTGVQKIQSTIRALTNTIESDKTRQQNLEIEFEKYEYIDKFEVDLEQLEKDEQRQGQRRATKEKLGTLIDQMHTTTNEIILVEKIVQPEVEVDALLEMMQNRNTADETMHSLMANIGELQTVEEMISEHETSLELEGLVNSIIEMIEHQAGLRGRADSSNILLNEINNSESTMTEIRSELIDMKKTFYQHMPEICPLCGSEIET